VHPDAPPADGDARRRGHFNGQSTIAVYGDHETGDGYTIAHHLFSTEGERKIKIASLRNLDTFIKRGAGCLVSAS
jgi:hypothetical protein